MRGEWAEEQRARSEGFVCIAGLDEAGRGALAGPVVAGCVVLPYERAPAGIDDSKALTPRQREAAYREILSCARGTGIGIVEPGVIDSVNILRASHLAMRQALAALPSGLRPDIALIDGLPVRPFPLEQIALIAGDRRSISIAAASIIAKVTRDRLMAELDAAYPGYGFAAHKGYPSPVHLQALKLLGPCAQHRMSYRPVQTVCAEMALQSPRARTAGKSPR